MKAVETKAKRELTPDQKAAKAKRARDRRAAQKGVEVPVKKMEAKKVEAKAEKAVKKVETKAAPKAKAPKKADGHGPTVHAAHPRCKCEKALYKWMGVVCDPNSKPAGKEDPYAFCRNKECDLYGVNQADKSTTKPISKVEKKADKPAEIEKTKNSDVSDDDEDDDDEDGDDGEESINEAAMTKARIRIEKYLARNDGSTQKAISLVLTIVKSEINQAAANDLIDEYKLDKKFSITKS
jgi:hypothetical protein